MPDLTNALPFARNLLAYGLSEAAAKASRLLVVVAVARSMGPAEIGLAAAAMAAGKMRQTAAIAGGQVVGANAMTAVLVLVWPSALALVLPRLLSVPIWLIAMRRLHRWRADRSARPAPLRPFLRFGWAVQGVGVVKALRLQADKLVIGRVLEAEVLGLYFMPLNAGLGLATSFSVAFSIVLFPHLCAVPDRTRALRQALLTAMGLIRLVGGGARVAGDRATHVLYRANPNGLSADLDRMRLGRESVLDTAARFGLRPDARAETVYARYLARRALRLDAGATVALGHTQRGLSQSPAAFLLPLRRGAATAIAACAAPLLPGALRRVLFSAI